MGIMNKINIINKKMIFCIIAVIGLFSLSILMFAFTGNVEAKKPRSTKTICVECHKTVSDAYKKKVKHAPFNKGLCTECHSPHASRFPKLLSKEGADLCLKCHKPFTGTVIHKPVEKGNCLSCHDPHSSNSKGLLKAKGGKTCLECHTQKEFKDRKNVHPLVKKLNCTKCHDPHSSKRDGLLKKSRTSICLTCHKTGTESMEKRHRGINVKGSDCVGCHNPHGSDNKKILQTFLHNPFEEGKCKTCHVSGSKKLNDNSTALCLKCHEKTLETFTKPKNHLFAGKGGNFCLNCHSAHGGSKKSMLKDRDHAVCYSCHMDSKHIANESRFVHPEIKNCTKCHVAHGGEDTFMLKDGGTGTCSTTECHASQGAFTHPVGEGVIDPRTNREMDCATCHAVMGSSFKPILRGEKNRGLCIECHDL